MKDKIKRIAKIAIYYSPSFIKSYLKGKVEKKRLKQGMENYKKHKVSKDEVEKILNDIDFNHDILLHTSTVNIGNIAGGVKFVTEALLSRMDLSKDTLLASALPFFGSFVDYLNRTDEFDVRTAPIAMGEINSRIARQPESRRSLHPTHSVVAVGRNAAEYTDSHHLDSTPFGPNSPYYKLIKNRGKVLLFGATMDNMTLVHAVEDAVGPHHPVKDIYHKKIYTVKCVNRDGETVSVTTTVHNPKRALYRRDIMLEHGLQKGYIRMWPLGAGAVIEVDAYQYAMNYIDRMKEGRNLYGKCKKIDSTLEIRFDD